MSIGMQGYDLMNKDAGTHAGTQANVARFNEIAATWDESPLRTELAQAVGHAILEAVVPKGTERALEFGCGTGLMTALLAPRLGHVVAADNSAGMLDILRDKMRQLGLDNIEPRRMDVGSEISGGPFDLIFSGMTLHQGYCAAWRPSWHRAGVSPSRTWKRRTGVSTAQPKASCITGSNRAKSCAGWSGRDWSRPPFGVSTAYAKPVPTSVSVTIPCSLLPP